MDHRMGIGGGGGPIRTPNRHWEGGESQSDHRDVVGVDVGQSDHRIDMGRVKANQITA